MRASITTLKNNSWSDLKQVTESLSKTCNKQKSTAIINVFDCKLPVKEFVAKLSELVTKPFVVTELPTKNGDIYYRVLVNPSFTDNNIDF